MKRKLLFSLAIFAGLSSMAFGQTQRKCASHENLQKQLQNPKNALQMQMLEENTRAYVEQMQERRQNQRLGADGETVIIPVVVHVIYNNSSQNISDAQIQSQLDVLNEDFSATNSDYGNTPSEFASVASGNTKIQFEMATVFVKIHGLQKL